MSQGYLPFFSFFSLSGKIHCSATVFRRLPVVFVRSFVVYQSNATQSRNNEDSGSVFSMVNDRLVIITGTTRANEERRNEQGLLIRERYSPLTGVTRMPFPVWIFPKVICIAIFVRNDVWNSISWIRYLNCWYYRWNISRILANAIMNRDFLFPFAINLPYICNR